MSRKHLKLIELHLHLEGAAPPDLIRRMARAKSIDLAGVFDENGAYILQDFAHFLRLYAAVSSVLKTPEDYARLTAAVLEHSAAEGVAYTEVFISPDFCGGGDLGAWREYLHAIHEAAIHAEAAHGIIMRGIATCIRHNGPYTARQTARVAADSAGDFIVGFGMGGDETMGRQGDFAWSFDCAREAGLKLTTHAGEFAGPESVRQALDDLNVHRIGHGVRAIEDPALVKRLADTGVVLEICPGSNVALGLYPDLRSHPIAKLRAAGVKVTVSTDDPPFFGTTMTREFDALAQTFDWDQSDLAALTRTALDAAFCDAALIQRLRDRLKLGSPTA